MQSKRPEYRHRRSRPWDEHEDRWEDRDACQDSYQKHVADEHISTKRTSRFRDYSDSPNTAYSKEPLTRGWSKKSSARRRTSSPDRDCEKKRFAEDYKEHYRYRPEPEDRTVRPSPDRLPHAGANKAFEHELLEEEDKHRKRPQESSHRYQYEESNYRQQYDDCRHLTGYPKDHDGSGSGRSRDHSTKSYATPRERNESRCSDHDASVEEKRRWQSSSGFPLNGQASRSPAVPEPKKSAEGFQRFLNVLNKGVNVATLTKIVTQSSREGDDRPASPARLGSTVRQWSSSYAGWQQGSDQFTRHWSESQQAHDVSAAPLTTAVTPATEPPSPTCFMNYDGWQQGSLPNTSYWAESEESPRRRHRSFSPQESCQPEDKCQPSYSSRSRSRSPSGGQLAVTAEDEHQHRQMQDVLQAIGLDLGSEELGQMSHRIRERLYGKNHSDCHRKGSRERNARRARSSRPRSRSSSSSSSSRSSSPLAEELCQRTAARAAQGVTETCGHEAAERGLSISTPQRSEAFPAYSQRSTAACHAFPQSSAHALQPRPPLPFPAPPPNLPQPGPGLFSPRLPFLPYPQIPPVNVLPAVLAQRHVVSPPCFELPPLNPLQKAKPLSRPRCLQVIETKQPG